MSLAYLSNIAIAQMRATLIGSFDTTAVRLVKSPVSDGRGGQSVTWTEAETFRCHLSTKGASRSTVEALGHVAEAVDHLLTYPHDQVLSAADRVRIDGRTFEISSVQHGSIDLHGRATLILMEAA